MLTLHTTSGNHGASSTSWALWVTHSTSITSGRKRPPERRTASTTINSSPPGCLCLRKFQLFQPDKAPLVVRAPWVLPTHSAQRATAWFGGAINNTTC